MPRQDLREEEFIRHKMFGDDKSGIRKYAELVIGEYNFFKLVKYELITFLFGPIPGALGLLLRGIFYPFLFK